jgi:hypothetical protein
MSTGNLNIRCITVVGKKETEGISAVDVSEPRTKMLGNDGIDILYFESRRIR